MGFCPCRCTQQEHENGTCQHKCWPSNDEWVKSQTRDGQRLNRAPELSLLVIDLGDNCVVKIEKGPVVKLWSLFADEHQNQPIGQAFIEHKTFAELRDVIDEQVKAPVPRIELSSNVAEGFKTFRLYLSNEDWNDDAVAVLAERELDALSKLVGHDLPIYEPQQGTWAQLYPVDAGGFIPVPSEISQSTPLSALSEWIRQFSIDMPLKVWRYTR